MAFFTVYFPYKYEAWENEALYKIKEIYYSCKEIEKRKLSEDFVEWLCQDGLNCATVSI